MRNLSRQVLRRPARFVRAGMIIGLLASTSCFAGGWTATAVPTGVDIVRGEGLMVHGSFGNPAGCTVADAFFVQISHPQYKEIYATLVLALATGKSIEAYAAECDPATWYSIPSTTYNTVTPSVSVNIHN